MSVEKNGSDSVRRVDADELQAITTQLRIEAIPTSNARIRLAPNLRGVAHRSSRGAHSPSRHGACRGRHTAAHFDPESGLHYNIIQSQTGRFVESDPISVFGGVATYDYALQRPLDAIDRNGGQAQLYYCTFHSPHGCVPPSPPPPPPPNGNVGGTFDHRDQVCSLPGHLGASANANPCIVACCQVHDDYYTKYNCNWTSWIGNVYAFPFPCRKCNSDVVDCITDALKHPCPN